jgi:hypothetical protein
MHRRVNMLREEIMQLSYRELDGVIAEKIFGYTHGKTPGDYNGLNGGEDILIPPNYNNYDFYYPPKGKISKYFHVPFYSIGPDSHKWAYEIEKRVSIGKISLYIQALKTILNVGYEKPEKENYIQLFSHEIYDLIHASPIDRLRAALLTLEGSGINETI